MKKILFLYPSNKRTVSLETLFRELTNKGYQVNMLTMCERGDLHYELEKYGISTYAYDLTKSNSLVFYMKQMLHLVKFCKQNQVDVIFSHLQMANLVAVFADFFIHTRVVAFRHHDFSRTRNEALGDKIINLLTEFIVVPSTGVRNLMLKNERVDADRLLLIPYMYDFSKYEYPDKDQVAQLRGRYIRSDRTLLLIMVARLVPSKRHTLVFQTVSQLVRQGYDLQVLVLDEGPEKAKLLKVVQELELEDHIHFIGFTRQVTYYLAAADIMIHPSLSEASNSAVKEAGLLEKAVAACQDVGDFSDYIVQEENGFLLTKEHTGQDIYKVIKRVYSERGLLKIMGKKLRETVLQKFSMSEETLSKYDQLLHPE